MDKFILILGWISLFSDYFSHILFFGIAETFANMDITIRLSMKIIHRT